MGVFKRLRRSDEWEEAEWLLQDQDGRTRVVYVDKAGTVKNVPASAISVLVTLHNESIKEGEE